MGRWKRYTGGSWVAQDGPSVGSAAELRHWQVKAALLDPLAYDTLNTSAATATVPAGETWYVVSGWNIDAGTHTTYQRMPDALGGNYYVLKGGEALTMEAIAGATAVICKPDVVIAADARYTADPRGLFYDRLDRLESDLAHYTIGHVNTGASVVSTAFPTDFTYGMVVHASSHDTAWTILRDTTSGAGINLNNETSDSDRIRFGERVTLPFTRAEFNYMESQGVSLPQGSASVRYVKLPADW